MYELLVKWGLETLGKALGDQASHEDDIVLEAVKTRNALVLERFRCATSSCEQLIDFTIRIEGELYDFQRETVGEERTKMSSRKYLGKLQREFHPRYLRECRKLLSLFDMTNDALSGYAMALTDWVQFSNIAQLCDRPEITSASDVSRIYRIVWTFLPSILSRLLRVTANDLRFWLTDSPYVVQAVKWARTKEMKALQTFFKEDSGGVEIYILTLEEPQQLRQFWDNNDSSLSG